MINPYITPYIYGYLHVQFLGTFTVFAPLGQIRSTFLRLVFGQRPGMHSQPVSDNTTADGNNYTTEWRMIYGGFSKIGNPKNGLTFSITIDGSYWMICGYPPFKKPSYSPR